MIHASSNAQVDRLFEKHTKGMDRNRFGCYDAMLDHGTRPYYNRFMFTVNAMLDELSQSARLVS